MQTEAENAHRRKLATSHVMARDTREKICPEIEVRRAPAVQISKLALSKDNIAVISRHEYYYGNDNQRNVEFTKHTT